MYSHCTTGGWILGNEIDGTQAEYVRIPHADTSLYPIPQGADEEALVMLSDILPTGFEFYSPAEIIMIDLDDNRLQVSKRFGATATINGSDGNAAETVMKMTGGRGVDTAIEAVGVPSYARTSWRLAARSLLWECMASRWIFTWNACGPGTSR
jgi:alcohol dehydrogenase